MSLEQLQADFKANSDVIKKLDNLTSTTDLVNLIKFTLWPFQENVLKEMAEMDEAVQDLLARKGPARQRIGGQYAQWQADQRGDQPDPQRQAHRLPFGRTKPGCDGIDHSGIVKPKSVQTVRAASDDR